MHQPTITEHATDVPGFRLVNARDVTFTEPRSIVHADFALKLTTAGRGAPLRYRGVDYAPCHAGQLSLFQPFEPLAAGRSQDCTSFTTLLIEPDLIDAANRALNGHSITNCTPHFLSAAVAVRLQSLATTLNQPPPARELAWQLSELLEELLATQPAPPQSALPPAVARAREIILDSLADNIPICQLEHECGLNRFYLIRAFRQHYGLPPREYRTQARIALARKLLTGGDCQAEIAQETGFYDQSHFHRHFRRITGMSPGRFQRVLTSRT